MVLYVYYYIEYISVRERDISVVLVVQNEKQNRINRIEESVILSSSFIKLFINYFVILL